MLPFYPIPPLPPRELFPSDKAYEIAKSRHEEARRLQSEMIKDEEAMMILAAVILVGLGILTLGFVSVMAFGWRGPFYGIAVCGLLWIAYRQIRVRL